MRIKKGASMKRILFSLLVAAVALGTSSLISAEEKKEPVTVKGWVTDTDCAAKCAKEKGAKWALYDPETKTVWVIADQAKASEMAGKKVAAKGMADMKTKQIWVDNYTPF